MALKGKLVTSTNKIAAMLKKFIINTIYKADSIILNKLGVLILSLNQQRKLGSSKIQKNKGLIFEVDKSETIPPLAWLCKVQGNSYHFNVGRNVEYSYGRVVEGAWDGDFNKSMIEASEFVFGSGAVLKKGKVVFIPPKHSLEVLYVLHDKQAGITYVSNSLCFILKSSNIDLDGDFFRKLSSELHRSGDIATKRGIDRYDQIIVAEKNYALYRMIFYNFSVDSGGRLRLYRKLPKKYFRDYGEYRKFLSGKISEIFNNAKSAHRKVVYTPITTITRGYDSPAVAVLAKENGCNEALTLNVSVYEVYDSGLDIGRKLGLKVYVYEHVMSDRIENLNIAFTERIKDLALEFIATGGIGDDVCFYPFQDKLIKRVFLTGSYGDPVWAKGSSLEPGLTNNTFFSKSLTEYRLRVGFIYLPVPFLGARFPGPIKAISNSADMRAFTVGGDYDRPIPRRIVEEVGIPRNEFGVGKCATAPYIINHKELFKDAVELVVQRYEVA
jgi:hypothetical protein